MKLDISERAFNPINVFESRRKSLEENSLQLISASTASIGFEKIVDLLRPKQTSESRSAYFAADACILQLKRMRYVECTHGLTSVDTMANCQKKP